MGHMAKTSTEFNEVLPLEVLPEQEMGYDFISPITRRPYLDALHRFEEVSLEWVPISHPKWPLYTFVHFLHSLHPPHIPYHLNHHF